MTELNNQTVLKWQQDQYSHDQRNHTDVLCLHRMERLRHFGLHFAKYAGRLAIGELCEYPVEQTIIDTVLVSLSTANALSQKLTPPKYTNKKLSEVEELKAFADAAGRFANACEKFDHMEKFISIAYTANQDIFNWALNAGKKRKINIEFELEERRLILSNRVFFVRDEK